MATWTQGTADEFIAMSKAGWAKEVKILHSLGGQSIDIAGHRAISQTKMKISQRALVDGVEVDVVCTGRFYDFLEKRGGRWGLVLRQPIYEQDRMDPVDPAERLELDRDLLGRFPDGYRHLAYLQTRIGYAVKPDMPGLRGREVEALYRSGAAWLAGAHARSLTRRAASAAFSPSKQCLTLLRTCEDECSSTGSVSPGKPPAPRMQARLDPRGRASTGELERRPVANIETKGLRVEGARRLEVVREHEHVLEPAQTHQPRTFILARP